MKLSLLVFFISAFTFPAWGNKAFDNIKIGPTWYIYVEVRFPKKTRSVERVTLAVKHNKANSGVDMCGPFSQNATAREEADSFIISYSDPMSLDSDGVVSRALTVETQEATFLYKLNLELKEPGTKKQWSPWQKADSVENDDACFDFINGKTTSSHSLKVPVSAPGIRYKLRKFSGGTRTQLDKWFEAE